MFSWAMWTLLAGGACEVAGHTLNASRDEKLRNAERMVATCPHCQKRCNAMNYGLFDCPECGGDFATGGYPK